MLQKLGRQLKGKSTVGGGSRRWIGRIGTTFTTLSVGIAYFPAAWLGLRCPAKRPRALDLDFWVDRGFPPIPGG